uniref:Uncharacterized protein LOC108042390 n=1 Tax=Drosophila rhopaloa TaxID=1041015 RepID=A0A6P4EHV1_DRORH
MNLEETHDPLEYWKQHEQEMPQLAISAKQGLCIPATSTESERMFSKAGLTISDRRASLKPKTVNILLFINKNWFLTKEKY